MKFPHKTHINHNYVGKDHCDKMYASALQVKCIVQLSMFVADYHYNV